jgi:hypothetical protein
LHFTIEDSDKLKSITGLFENHCQGFRMLTIQVNKEMATRYQYAITLNNGVLKDDFINDIKAIEGISQIKLSSNENLPD